MTEEDAMAISVNRRATRFVLSSTSLVETSVMLLPHSSGKSTVPTVACLRKGLDAGTRKRTNSIMWTQLADLGPQATLRIGGTPARIAEAERHAITFI